MDSIEIKTETPDIGPVEFVEISESSKNISQWSNDETRQLLELYEDFINEVGSEKRFRHKRDMWNEISLHIPYKNSKQCEERFKTLLRRKKKGIENVSTSEPKIKRFKSNDNEEGFQIITKRIRLSDERVTPFKKLQVWSNYETKLLMELYTRFICEVGPQKRFLHKKDMWAEISTNFPTKDSKQCQERYKTVLKRKKNRFTKTVYISKARRNTIDFKAVDNEKNSIKIKRVYAIKNNTINHDKLEVENNVKQEQANAEANSPTLIGSEQVLTISETLLKIAAKKEEGRERRHREKMKVIEQIQNSLQQLLNTKNK